MEGSLERAETTRQSARRLAAAGLGSQLPQVGNRGVLAPSIQVEAVSTVDQLVEELAAEAPRRNHQRHSTAAAGEQILAQLEQRRLIVRLIADGVTQVEVARLFGVSQPTMNGRLQTARQVAPVREGFSGASPGELCQRYAAGLMSRAQLVDELSRWDYPAVLKGDPWDDLVIRPEGSFNEVGRAFRRGLIDAELYDEILDAVAQD